MKYLVRLTSELTLKSSAVRRRFVNVLMTNLKRSFKRSNFLATIDNQWHRLFVETEDAHADELKSILSRTFGISSFSPLVAQCPPDLDEIVSCGVEHFSEYVRGKTFAVEARRAGAHSFTSLEVNQKLGAALRPLATKVDINHPQVWIGVEIRPESSYFYAQKIPGGLGLPLGTGGRVLCLLSGGFDSVVAAWMLLKRGVEVDFVFFNLVAEQLQDEVVAIAEQLVRTWGNGRRFAFYGVNFIEVADHLKKNSRDAYVQVLLKRCFYRAANKLAHEFHYEAIVTGEAIGQVSSQTLANLCAIEKGLDRVVLRPLVAYDKQDIIDLSRRIGVYELCAKVKEYCQLVPQKPVTNAQISAVLEQEKRVDVDLIEKAVKAVKMTTLPRVQMGSSTEVDLRIIQTREAEPIFISRIPEGAFVVDFRAPSANSLNDSRVRFSNLDEVLLNNLELNSNQTYVFICEQGMQSVVAAQFARSSGFKAFALKQ